MPHTGPPRSRHRTHAGEIDYTKTRHYAYIDLITKVIASVALVLLGVAGWLLQARSENSRESAAELERQERRYLPMLRSLSELELVLEHTVAVVREPPGELPDREQLDNVATQLRYVAYSVFTPDGDPLVSLKLSKGDTTHYLPDVSMPLRSTAIMYGELLQLIAWQSPSIDMKIELRFSRSRRGYKPGTTSVGCGDRSLGISRDSFPAWSRWFGSDDVEQLELADLHYLLSSLHNGVTETIHETLSAHVDLGDRYLVIRSEALKDRPLLNGSERPPAAEK